MELVDIYDNSDLKVKHASGEYKNMLNSPEPDDIIHFFFSSKKKFLIVDDIIKFFGDEKKEIIKKSLTSLKEDGLLICEPKVNGQEITDFIVDCKFKF